MSKIPIYVSSFGHSLFFLAWVFPARGGINSVLAPRPAGFRKEKEIRNPHSEIRNGVPATRKRAPDFSVRPFSKNIPATCYSPMAACHSTLAAEALHFRVRNGNGCYLLAMVTGKKVKHIEGRKQ